MQDVAAALPHRQTDPEHDPEQQSRSEQSPPSGTQVARATHTDPWQLPSQQSMSLQFPPRAAQRTASRGMQTDPWHAPSQQSVLEQSPPSAAQWPPAPLSAEWSLWGPSTGGLCDVSGSSSPEHPMTTPMENIATNARRARENTPRAHDMKGPLSSLTWPHGSATCHGPLLTWNLTSCWPSPDGFAQRPGRSRSPRRSTARLRAWRSARRPSARWGCPACCSRGGPWGRGL